jgi:hypothetical protein
MYQMHVGILVVLIFLVFGYKFGALLKEGYQILTQILICTKCRPNVPLILGVGKFIWYIYLVYVSLGLYYNSNIGFPA